MADYSTLDWQYISEALTRQFGADHAQEALCRLVEKLSNGAEIDNPLAYAARTCKGLAYEEQNPKTQRVSIDALLSKLGDSMRAVPQLIDNDHPEALAIAAEEERRIAAIREQHRGVLSQALSRATRYRKLQEYRAEIREAR